MFKLLFGMVMMMGILLTAIPAEASSHDLSPQWISELPAAQDARQLFVVGGIGETTAWISMHEKDNDGNWYQIMSTPGFIGKSGLGKTKEGDAKTPVGVFHFTEAFGIAPNPGCEINYTKVDENLYWSGDVRPGMAYNKMVDIRNYPDLDKDASEHIIDYNPAYIYGMNISWNEDCVPGLGSAIFLHCFGLQKPYTGGCVAIPEDKMRFVLQHVHKDCVVVIDYLKNLSPETCTQWNI